VNKYQEAFAMNGKALRLKRLIAPQDGRMVILPMDHGVSCGPIPGLQRLEQAISVGIQGGADALVLHKGMLPYLEPVAQALPGIFLHLSASTQLGPAFHHKVLVGSVEEAVRRGADGVSVHVNLGDDHEAEMLRDLGEVGGACALWQMPLLVMIYVRGTHIPSPPPDSAIAHAARVAAELGADVIKLPAPADVDALAAITAASPVPVVVAGGSKVPHVKALLERVEMVLQAGARGVAMGRNVFQSEQPELLLRIIAAMVHEEWSAERAAEALGTGGDRS
jgi:predicted phospho-2-dehydro-3-deoxyheptonate aldolase